MITTGVIYYYDCWNFSSGDDDLLWKQPQHQQYIPTDYISELWLCYRTQHTYNIVHIVVKLTLKILIDNFLLTLKPILTPLVTRLVSLKIKIALPSRLIMRDSMKVDMDVVGKHLNRRQVGKSIRYVGCVDTWISEIEHRV
jgi:hypothetical protein